ncbi:MAG: copper ion binding protein [Clostridiales Family XIII bacterium]|jgi:copper chaperone|nr:copper ion binding protein [Clostridiales Family XIII bacterium]
MSNVTNTVINVVGMSCQHCVNAVTEATTALPSVSDVNVDLTAGTVSLSYDSDAVSLDAIKGAIDEVGFEVA